MMMLVCSQEDENQRKANLRDVRPRVEDDAKWRKPEFASPSPTLTDYLTFVV
jgi:hypothetical protein